MEDRHEDKVLYTCHPPSYLDTITFGYLNRVILFGSKHTIRFWDLNPLYKNFSAGHCLERIRRQWNYLARDLQDEKCDHGNSEDSEFVIPEEAEEDFSMVWLILRAFRRPLATVFVLQLAQCFSTLSPAFLLGIVMDFLTSTQPDHMGYVYAILLMLVQTVDSVLIAQIYGTLFNTSIRVKSGLSSAIYHKVLRLSAHSHRHFSTGDIVNLISVDLGNVSAAITHSSDLWPPPISMVLTFLVIYQHLGWYSFAGFVVILTYIPLSTMMARFERQLQAKQMVKKDERIGLITEIFNNIKILKLYAWEHSFINKVKAIRDQEAHLSYIYLAICNTFNFVWNCFPFLVFSSAMCAYLLLNPENVLTPKKILVSISLFNQLRLQVRDLPSAVSTMAKASVSLNRIKMFLMAAEIDDESVLDDTEEELDIKVENASFSWDPDYTAVLKNLNLSIQRGELVAIVGPVAAGKSSFIQAILGELFGISGSLTRRRQSTVAYVSQQAWIQNATIRNNILFGKPFDPFLYKSVLKKCCLLPDLKVLPGGDQTEIGERGVNLSGGQKQRVSLARAVYQKADIYLLDDPLSAVDSNVAQSLFSDVIGPRGLLKYKTRVLVTHSLSVLHEVDRIMILEDGRIVKSGGYHDIVKSEVTLKDLIDKVSEDKVNEETENLEVDGHQLLERSLSGNSDAGRSFERQDSVASETSKGKLIEDEEIQTGKVRWSVYAEFLSQFGITAFMLSLCGYIVSRLADAASLYYLTKWADSETELSHGSLGTWHQIKIYLAFGGVHAGSMLTAIIILSFGCVATSTRLHNSMLNALLRAPMSFLESTPTGRILNRFSHDVDELDLTLWDDMNGYLECAVGFTTVMILVAVNIPTFIIFLLPLILVFVIIQHFYMTSSRQVKRLNAVSKSPVLNSFHETVAGASTIRAYNAKERFATFNMKITDVNQNCQFHEFNGYRWLALRLNLLANLLDAAVLCLITYYRNEINPVTGGLVLAYAIQASGLLTWVVRLGAQVENTVVSAERMIEYTRVAQEADWDMGVLVDDSWPSRGAIEFRNYSTKYRQSLEPVLRDINIEIGARQKVGIVGRTGAGKSSLTLALLRVIEATEGKILIDGVDISCLGLHVLRSRVAMIPQDPVLFMGTLRSNIDPEEKYSDGEVFSALKRAHFSKEKKSISFLVEEGGQNLSVGERQLVCLGRALLRNARVLILDEATASLDLETDALIQKTIREDFKECTVITIAHRLHTILDYDKVIILDKGTVKEVGSPQGLLSRRDTIFASMVNDSSMRH